MMAASMCLTVNVAFAVPSGDVRDDYTWHYEESSRYGYCEVLPGQSVNVVLRDLEEPWVFIITHISDRV